MTVASSSKPGNTLLATLLAEQSELTAIDRFVRAQRETGDGPIQARYYKSLIPLGQPGQGEQYAFSVDLDSCSGCKACVSACHSLNGLDDHEVWRTTGLLHGGTAAEPYQQVITTACHHCLEPACLNGCPVLAYEKDPFTGIVRHLDDQCIGCQYCILKCPYDVPKYSSARGIVRKCDMCHGRLAAGEAPACVQACPTEAIRITIVSQGAIAERSVHPGTQLVPGTVLSSYTLPSTVYTTLRGFPDNVEPADATVLRTQPAHWPLIWMLLLTQAAAGMSVGTFLLSCLHLDKLRELERTLTGPTVALLSFGLLASAFHLGRPMGAWRAFLGWRHSWMSREIIAFVAFALASVTQVVLGSLRVPQWAWTGLSGVTATLGLISVFCSSMVYIDTRRPFWTPQETFFRFFGTTLLLGAAGIAAVPSAWNLWSPKQLGIGATAAVMALFLRGAVLLWEGAGFALALGNSEDPQHGSARLIWEFCATALIVRWIACLVATTTGFFGLLHAGPPAQAALAISFAATFVSRLVERYCFFVAVIPPRMPGGL